MEDSQHKERTEREHFFGSAKVIAGLTFVSRIAGMVRAMAIASFGANLLTDAFTFAFQIPNLLRRLFAEGALSAAFVPIFTDTIESGPDGHARASRLLANAMGLLALLLAAIWVLAQLGLLAWWLFSPGPYHRQLLILLTSLMLPFMVTICLLALASAALNCRGHFIYPAATPIILNVIIIAAAYAVPSFIGDVGEQLMVVAASVSVAGVVQFAGVFVLLRRCGFAIRWKLRPIEPGVKPMVRLMAPMLIPLGLLQFAELLETSLAWFLVATPESPTLHLLGIELAKPFSPGTVLQLGSARLLYQFPMGVLAISLGVAVFPLLSRYASRGDMPNLRDSVNRALRLSFMEGMATGVGLLLLAEPITTLLFLYRKFTLGDVAATAYILEMYVAGMWAYCTYQIVVRAFYAMKDTKTPLKISCFLAAAHLAAVAGLVWVPGLGAGAFGLATAITFAINTVVLAMMLRKRVGLLGGRKMLRSFARTIAACAMMAVVLGWLLTELGSPPLGLPIRPLIGLSLPADWGPRLTSLVVVAIALPVGVAVFIAAARAMGAPELGELFGAVGQRIRRKRT